MNYYAEIGAHSSPYWGIEKIKEGGFTFFVEPNPFVFADLLNIFKDEPELLAQATFCNFAVSGRWDIGKFNIVEGYEIASHLDRTPDESLAIQKDQYDILQIQTCVVSFTEFMNLREFCAIRMDIEGAEWECFSHWDPQYYPEEILVEFHTRYNESESVEFLKSCGYKVVDIIRPDSSRPEYTFKRS